MRRKLVWTLWIAAVLGLVLTGCGQQRAQASYIGADAAKAIALDTAGIAEGAAAFTSTDLENRNGTDYYQVKFTADGQNYTYDVDAVTGVVIGQDGQNAPVEKPSTNTATAGTATTNVDEGKAKEIALNHAGLTEDQVSFVRSRLDWENGRQVYDVEFYTSDYKEYDYEIDANTGEILSYDYDAEGYAPPTASGSQVISADRAKEIALAEVPGATTKDIYEFDVDRDDGRLEYEGTIYYNGVEYEFSIDGYSGAIRGWEVDSHR